jgi:hypothetical protein
MKFARAFVGTAMILVSSWSLLNGCGFLLAPSASSSDASADGSTSSDASDGGAFGTSDANAFKCEVPARPGWMPDGWVLFDKYPCCGLYVPTSTDLLPPPVQWQACAGDAGDGVNCRVMSNAVGAPEWGVSVTDAGVALEAYELMPNDAGAFVVAEADGPVHQAIMDTDPQCGGLTLSDMNGGKYAFRFYWGDSFEGGEVLGGSVDEFHPSLVESLAPGENDVAAGPLGLLDMATSDFELHTWSQPDLVMSIAKANGYFPAFTSNAIFWSENEGQQVQMYMPSTGVIDLISMPTYAVQNAADFGADDYDFVWVEGQGWDPTTETFASAAYYTSPYTTDPAQITRRRLTAESPTSFGDSYTKVGCGYAAHTNEAGVRVVRIADGVSWLLTNEPGYNFVEPLGITCTEIFVDVGIGDGNISIARVRLDSLGPGMPPQ